MPSSLLSVWLQGPTLKAERQLLSSLLDAADLAYAAYKINPQSVCAVSHLRVRVWVGGGGGLGVFCVCVGGGGQGECPEGVPLWGGGGAGVLGAAGGVAFVPGG